jgi:hypothetical protein
MLLRKFLNENFKIDENSENVHENEKVCYFHCLLVEALFTTLVNFFKVLIPIPQVPVVHTIHVSAIFFNFRKKFLRIFLRKCSHFRNSKTIIFSKFS